MGLGQWLLISGLQQIDAELELCRRLLDPPPANLLLQLILEGRLRELRSGPDACCSGSGGRSSLAWGATGLPPEPKSPADEPPPAASRGQHRHHPAAAHRRWRCGRRSSNG